MMVADVGYGLVMFIAAFCAMKFLKLNKKNEDFAAEVAAQING